MNEDTHKEIELGDGLTMGELTVVDMSCLRVLTPANQAKVMRLIADLKWEQRT